VSDVAGEYLPTPEDEPSAKPKPDKPSTDAPLRLGEYDIGEDEIAGSPTGRRPHVAKMVQFYSPMDLLAYQPPPDYCLVGDKHIARGEFSILAGDSGSRKSRALLWLAVLGMLGCGNWLGFEVRSKFRTLILQNENGLTRLHDDMLALEQSGIVKIAELQEWLRVSVIPFGGRPLGNLDFQREVKAELGSFKPGLMGLDPFNEAVEDETLKEFSRGLAELRRMLHGVEPPPACMILHHFRKPKAEDARSGRSLAHLLSGSYKLRSAGRSLIAVQLASNEVNEDRLVVTCLKNNNGPYGQRTAWLRKAAWFEPLPDFDLTKFDSGGEKHEAKVKEEHIRQLFKDERWLQRSKAVPMLEKIAQVGRSAAYEALKWNGRFADMLTEHPEREEWIGLRMGEADSNTADNAGESESP
jgi:hypothetical protein